MQNLPDIMNRPSKRRKRTVLTAKQHRILSKFFLECAFPDAEQRSKLGKALDMTSRTVQIWFQNQRQKVRSNVGENKCFFDYEDLRDDIVELPSEKSSSSEKSLLVLANAACIEYNKRFGNNKNDNLKNRCSSSNITYNSRM